jgi:hypothetical protein
MEDQISSGRYPRGSRGLPADDPTLQLAGRGRHRLGRPIPKIALITVVVAGLGGAAIGAAETTQPPVRPAVSHAGPRPRVVSPLFVRAAAEAAADARANLGEPAIGLAKLRRIVAKVGAGQSLAPPRRGH